MSAPESAVRADGPVLEMRGVRKHFGGVPAVAGVDLALGREEFLTFLGPSGSGKTTTLLMVAGLLAPDAGEIVLAGRPVARLPAHRRDVGMVFQHYALFPHMSVAGNVAFPLEMRRVGRTERAARVRAALDLVGLGDLGDRAPRELSGGQQQRVALARALVYDPALLLMDEPLGALDRKLREGLQREIRRIHRERRVPVLYVTHDQEEALTMSDRVAVFNAGRIEQIGTPADLYERPATRFVAGFVGEMNFLPAEIVDREGEEGGRVVLDVAGHRAGATTSRRLAPRERVVAAVRPERVVLTPGGAGLPARVVDVVFLGNARRVLVRLPDGRDCVVLQSVEAAERAVLVPGQSVSLDWRAQHAIAYPESE